MLLFIYRKLPNPDAGLSSLPAFKGLNPLQASQARAPFAKYEGIFSQTDQDSGCTSLIAH